MVARRIRGPDYESLDYSKQGSFISQKTRAWLKICSSEALCCEAEMGTRFAEQREAHLGVIICHWRPLPVGQRTEWKSYQYNPIRVKHLRFETLVHIFLY